MPDFAKLSALQWKIIREAIASQSCSLPDRADVLWSGLPRTEGERVARSRAISRLVARGIIKREGYTYFRIDPKAPIDRSGIRRTEALTLIASTADVEREAQAAWFRDRCRGVERHDSSAWLVLYQIRRNAHMRLASLGGSAVARYRRQKRDQRPTRRERGTRGAVASAVKLLATRGQRVNVKAIVKLLNGVLDQDVVRQALANLKASGDYARIIGEAP